MDENQDLDDLDHQPDSVSSSIKPPPDASVVVIGDSFKIDKVNVLRNCISLLPERFDGRVSIDSFIFNLRLVPPNFSLQFLKFVMCSVGIY